MTSRPLFLVCNDDGVHAPGIKALAASVEHLGDVVVVAPHIERSGFSQALTLMSPLRLEQLDERTYAVDGTPADCVVMAINKILPRKPDFVLSGINRGSNIGQDTLYSGTIAAAMEGVMQGVPAIAFSLDHRRAFALSDYTQAAKIAGYIVENRALFVRARHAVINVNIPDLNNHRSTLSEPKGIAVTPLGRRIYDKQIAESTDPRGRSYFWIGGGGEDIEDLPGTDCVMLRDGWVTLTTLIPDHVDVGVQKHFAEEVVPDLSKGLRGLKQVF